MGEKQVTIDNVTHSLSELFFVIATQNPLDQVGTYPLPIAQLDRFLFKIRMTNIQRSDELRVIQSWGKTHPNTTLPLVTVDQILAARNTVINEIAIDDAILECLVDIIRTIRDDERCLQGASTRSIVQAVAALQAHALLQGRDFVTPADIEQLLIPLFSHRLQLSPGAGNPDTLVRNAAEAPLKQLSKRALHA